MRVHQFVPTFEAGAIGNHIVELQARLEAAGVHGEVFADRAVGPWEGRSQHFSRYGAGYAARPDDVLVYHMAIASGVAEFVAQRPERLAVWHHNLTPARYFERWEPRAVPGITHGRRQLVDLAPRTTLAIADSAFNACELADVGYANPIVIPIILDEQRFDAVPDPRVLTRIQHEPAASRILFVGRLAPNKCQHDLVRMLAVYRKAFDPHATLHLVGPTESTRYESAVRGLASELGLSAAVEITGSVSREALCAYYRIADVFVSLSEHEGFCVPLLEAMMNEVPVVAFGATAVPETLGGSGLVLPEKDLVFAATATARVVGDAALRSRLVAAGAQRLAEFDPATATQRLLEHLAMIAPSVAR